MDAVNGRSLITSPTWIEDVDVMGVSTREFGKAEARFKDVKFQKTLPYKPYTETGNSGVGTSELAQFVSEDALTGPGLRHKADN
jgi:hypothetical protein